MLNINIDDVLNIVEQCVPYLIFFGIVLVAAVLVMIFCKKAEKAKKYVIRWQAGVALIAAFVLTVNFICFGPMSTIISLTMGKGTISEETTKEAEALVEKIADEGIVLLENKNQLLPLTENKKLNVFGWGSTNPCYGGTGSGALSDSFPTVSLLGGLENAGFTLNTELLDFYTNYRADRPVVGMFEQDWTLPEPPADTYSNELVENAVDFSDTALVTITRVGGEGADLPRDMAAITYNNNSEAYDDFASDEHYLELNKTERDMLELVCENFENVILVYNGANAFEMGFVKDYKQIKSVIWCPGTGQTGFNSLGSIISGEVNPSGRTPDTFVYDLKKAPNYNNVGAFVYDNMEEYQGDAFKRKSTPSFVNYVEGIYVGYRFYETAAVEGVIDYDEVVAYPFGYGLSYTEFSQKMGELEVDADGKISVDVTVTNEGTVAGKEVVQVYYNPVYTNGGIEKSAVNLAAFAKTQTLKPGESETIKISFNEEDMASYDSSGAGNYILEAGDYEVSLRKDSHTIIDSKKHIVASEVVYNESNGRSTDQAAVENQFADAQGDVEYLSRKDGFANYEKATAAPAAFTLSDEYKEKFINNSNYNPEDFNDDSDEMSVTGAKNGKSLQEMRGLEYDDPAWEPLLDQLKVGEMQKLIALGGYQTPAVKSVDKRATIDCDGPASINNNFTKVGSIGFPSAVVIASTWSEELALEFGESIGKMANEMGTSGWYAPAMNIHRSAFAGRNFEYYSEDGVLSGRMAVNAVLGAEKSGVYAYLKHFALNDQEDARLDMLCTWSTEQAIREIYLKPFEISVKEGNAKAIMSSFNYIGTTWAGASNALLNNVLRGEWGFRGFVLTDYFGGGGYGYMNADQAIRNGNDTCLASYDVETNNVIDTTSATSVKAMRQASKNILYTVVNSRAYSAEVSAEGMENWKMFAIGIDVVIAGLLIILEVTVVKKGYKKRKAAADAIEE
jgi:beta-glucosidase